MGRFATVCDSVAFRDMLSSSIFGSFGFQMALWMHDGSGPTQQLAQQQERLE
jgi:hypothetical protein